MAAKAKNPVMTSEITDSTRKAAKIFARTFNLIRGGESVVIMDVADCYSGST
jgi:hypothetical protein